ncbi:hypothetical protein Cpap_0192 [Ruminiclostridium papyrosolvens DSM 2782]|uniref:Uncharacterized protein n=1 Tax=Ruminiclostridium papyrosolvens DSM 2782 TaxID=588581 RepID=F1TIK6_9FIRM|nr:hypothetical protein [Ruminiclostridium papyrosolvens]EGD45823.1 hypothetical protein Cpap_0192 [Ruminiclostridium papyrosolvens DSM 2782]WES33857.1 hypothetical protein P0092_19135 [Ruminiclostridium papyrosolvens DSM 2782]
MAKSKIHIHLKKLIESHDYKEIVATLSSIKTSNEVELLTSNKIILKLYIMISENPSLDTYRNEMFDAYINAVEKISFQLSQEQMFLWTFTEDLVSCNLAYNKLCSQVMEEMFDSSLGKFVSVFGARENEQYNAGDLTNLSDLPKTHYSLGRRLDNERVNLYIFSMAIKYLQNDLLTGDFICDPYINYKSDFNKVFELTKLIMGINTIYDKLCFGEYKISAIDKKGNLLKYIIDIKDRQLMNAKYISLRRGIAQRLYSEHLHILDYMPDVIDDIIEIGKYLKCTKNETDLVLDKIKVLTRLSENELLFLKVSKQVQVLMRVIIGICMFFFYDGMLLKKRNSVKNEYASIFDMNFFVMYVLENSFLTQSQIQGFFKYFIVNNQLEVGEIYKKLSLLPLIKVGESSFECFHSLPICSEGVISVILNFINSKSEISKQFFNPDLSNKYGNEFNLQIVEMMKSYGWQLIELDVKVKEGKKILSDIDAILFKEGFLLAIQSKSVIRSEDIYSHYKAKERIKEGITQAQISKKYFLNDNESYRNLLKAKNLCFNDIKQIIPLVVSNSDMFTGWNNSEDIPVVSTDYLFNVISRYPIDKINKLLNNPYYFEEYYKDLSYKFIPLNAFNLFWIEYEDLYCDN